jgi:hypothetical protein
MTEAHPPQTVVGEEFPKKPAFAKRAAQDLFRRFGPSKRAVPGMTRCRNGSMFVPRTMSQLCEGGIMQRRLFCPILAAAVLLTALVGGADRASAAIRITISDGTTDKVFLSTNSQTALFLTDLGAFDLMIHTTITNYPGQASGGSLSQTINLSDNLDQTSGTLPQFTFLSEVIRDEDVVGISSGEVTGAQRTTVEAANLARFTLPAGSLLHVVSDIAATDPNALTMNAGTVQNITNVNGEDVAATALVNDPLPTIKGIEDVANDPAVGFTLTSEVILTDARVGASSLGISASSGVTAGPVGAELTPEPGSMIVWALGGLGLALAGAARRRFARPKV